jgi:hypothetical protein
VPLQPKKKEQIAFNEALVNNASEMLAPVNGQEKFLSVSCGHTAAFCKAANHGCKTFQEQLAENGKLSVQALASRDATFGKMLTRGWGWTIVSWQVEAQFPELPHLAQQALNASHNVAAMVSELETASTLAEYAALFQSAGKPVDWAECIQAAGASNPA